MHRISDLIYEIAGLAPAPHNLPRLNLLLRDLNGNLEEIQQLIECDPNLTASILRWCNSAEVRGSEPVATVQEALQRMGFKPIVELVVLLMSSAAFALPPGTETHLKGLWEHSLLTALLTRKLSRNQEEMAEAGFTAGLLHDLGKVIMIKAAPSQYMRSLELAKRRHRAVIDQEEEDFECNHANVGSLVLARWNLPSMVVTAIQFHHHPELSGAEHPLACCIELADSLAYAVGCGLSGQYSRHRDTTQLLGALDLVPADVGVILQESLEEMEIMKRCVPAPA